LGAVAKPLQMQGPGGARSAEVAAGLAPSNALGCSLGAIACSTTAVGIALSMHPALSFWLIGQSVLAIALLQWFVVLHEAGHGTLFRTRLLNRLAGHLGGFFALIPYASWRRVHGLHHVWTGWQDLDPTTAGLAPRSRSRIACVLVDWAWRTGLPLFSIVYRLSNYWNVVRLAAIFSARQQRAVLALNVAILASIYGLLAWHLGFAESVRIGALALFVSLALQDPLILSQHTHIPQRLSLGRAVDPLPPAAQVQYTRSLRFPGWVSRWILFGFDAHELHHRFPAVPGFRLRRIVHTPGNEVHWWSWLRAAKRQRGSTLLFENSDVTGFRG
jgi:acyl-lipid omega-6 desaturase (Delta-12 desaturase)